MKPNKVPKLVASRIVPYSTSWRGAGLQVMCHADPTCLTALM